MPLAFGNFAWVWAAFFALYLSQVSPWSAQEFVAGAVTAGLAAAALRSIRRCSDVQFAFRWQWLWLLARRLPSRALADCGVVLKALGRKRTIGEFRAIPFEKDAGRRRSENLGRRALVIAGVSVSPNSVVIAVDSKKDRLLVHQLVHTRNPPGDGNRLWPL